MVKIELEVPSGGIFKSLFETMKRIRPKYDKKINDLLESYAKSNHEYTSRTGTLESATISKGSLKDEINLYVDDNIADYGVYVAYNTSDDFIDDALKANEKEIYEIIKDMYSEAITIYNRG